MGNVFDEYAEAYHKEHIKETLLETAANMLKANFSIDTISKVMPSLSMEQLTALEEQLKLQV